MSIPEGLQPPEGCAAQASPAMSLAGWGSMGCPGGDVWGASGSLANASTAPAVHNGLDTASTAGVQHTLSLPLIAEKN